MKNQAVLAGPLFNSLPLWTGIILIPMLLGHFKSNLYILPFQFNSGALISLSNKIFCSNTGRMVNLLLLGASHASVPPPHPHV